VKSLRSFFSTEEINIKELGIYIIIILALLRFVDTPLKQRRDESLSRLSVLIKEKNTLQRIAKKLKKMEKEIDKRQAVLKNSEERFYSSNISDIELYASMIKNLTTFAKKEQLKLIYFSTSQPSGHEIKTYTVTLRMSGNMKALTNFIIDVKKLKKIYLIKSLNLTPRKSGLMIRIDIEGYKLRK
jgi:Tfp pilus assembly protein PilO